MVDIFSTRFLILAHPFADYILISKMKGDVLDIKKDLTCRIVNFLDIIYLLDLMDLSDLADFSKLLGAFHIVSN